MTVRTAYNADGNVSAVTAVNAATGDQTTQYVYGTTLSDSDCTRRHGIPVTTPNRTLNDLHPILSPAGFASALREAEFLGLPIKRPDEPAHARSELEQKFLTLCRRHRLPQPGVNVRVATDVVDFLWPDEHVIVEVDGWESHRTRSAFEEDRARDAHLTALGYSVIRLTWRRLGEDGPNVAKTIRSLLRTRAA